MTDTKDYMREYYLTVIKPNRGYGDRKGRPRKYNGYEDAYAAVKARTKAKRMNDDPFYNINEDLTNIIHNRGLTPSIDMRTQLLDLVNRFIADRENSVNIVSTL